jgi:tRNA nucleotidyltransferase (CCA-adding enzyme)
LLVCDSAKCLARYATVLNASQQSLLKLISDLAIAQGRKVYLVGGIVRDLIRGEGFEDKDLDFLVDRDAIGFSEVVAAELKGKRSVFERFLTAKISEIVGFGSVTEVDFATARTEFYVEPGALPEVQPSDSIESDLKRRDFSINSLALEIKEFLDWSAGGSADLSILRQRVLDPWKGLEDLNSRTIRVLHDRSFLDDPTRCFRALRYLVRIDGELDRQTEKLLRAAVAGGALGTISIERQRNELKRGLEEPNPTQAMELFQSFELLTSVLPMNQGEFSRLLAELKALGSKGTVGWEEFLGVIATSAAPEHVEDLLKRLGVGAKRIRNLTAKSINNR